MKFPVERPIVMDEPTHPIVEFEEHIRPFRQTWKGVDVRALCDLQDDLLLSLVACLTLDEPKPVETVDQIQEIAFVRGVLPLHEIDGLLASLRTGSLSLGPYSLSTQEFENYRFHSLDRLRDEDLGNGWPELSHFSQLSLQAWGKRNLEAIATPRDLWAGARIQGFSSFNELCLQRLQFDVGGGKVLRVKVYAPLMIYIEGHIEGGEVRFQIRFPASLPPNSLNLTFRIQDGRGNRLQSGQFDASNLHLSTNDGWASLGGSISLSADSARVELRAFSTAYKLGTEVVAAEFFEIPLPAGQENPRWNLLRSLIANTRTWTRQASWTTPESTLMQWLGLSTPRPTNEDFERGVHCLLFLSGCSSVHVGSAEGVDFGMFEAAEEKLAALISCTTSPDVRGKFNPLLLQRNRLTERFAGTDVIAAVFAPVELEDLTMRTIQEANESHIRLVLLPQLRELCRKAIGRDWKATHENLLAYLAESPGF